MMQTSEKKSLYCGSLTAFLFNMELQLSSHGETIHKGYLRQKGSDDIYKRRYGVIWEDMVLRLYDSERRGLHLEEMDLKYFQEVIPLSQSKHHEYNSNLHCLVIKSNSLKAAWIFGFDTEKQSSEWMRIINEQIEGNPFIVQLTQYVTFHYIRANMESLYGIDRIFQFPQGLIYLCSSFIGSIMNETQYLNYLEDRNKAYKSQIAETRKEFNKNSFDTILSEILTGSKIIKHIPVEIKKYEGHFGKLYALDWTCDSKYIVTCSQDGKLILWDAFTTNKRMEIVCNSAWIHAVTFSPKYDFIAWGGLDNTVTISKCTDNDGHKLMSDNRIGTFEKHEGYVSCIRFVNSDNEVLSSSGDSTCILWDVEKGDIKDRFTHHTGDVMWVDVNKHNPNLFISSSVDCTVRIWDIRDRDKQVGMFDGHKSDINNVRWFPDGNGFVSGSDDGTVRYFDIKAYRQMNVYCDQNNGSLHSPDQSGVTSIAVSLSGSYIYSAYDNGMVYMWSTLKSDECLHKIPHASRVSAIAISPNGYALATASWDFNLRLFV